MTIKAINSEESYPPMPGNIGRKTRIKTQSGKERHFTIEDEIIQPQHNAPHKLISFQKMYYEEEKRYEFRFGYYMIGIKGKPKGKWVWGQYCLFMPKKDLVNILKKAYKRKWF